MKRCPIAAKIAGSIGILPCCVLKEFSHNRVYAYICITYFTGLKKNPKKTRHRTDIEADYGPETGYFFGLILIAKVRCSGSVSRS